MQSKDFNKGLAIGLVLAGIVFENTDTGGGAGGQLPDGSRLKIVNCDYYRGSAGHGVAYLNDYSFSTVFSSDVRYAPKSGIVIMGAFDLTDWDNWGGTRAEAVLRIIIDGETHYEGDVYRYFKASYSREPLKEMKAFSYKDWFIIEAKRLNLSDSMALEIYRTCIIET